MAWAGSGDVHFPSEVTWALAQTQLGGALAPQQALPLALESPRALEVVGEQDKETGSTHAFPKTGKVPLSFPCVREFRPKNFPSPAHLP